MKEELLRQPLCQCTAKDEEVKACEQRRGTFGCDG